MVAGVWVGSEGHFIALLSREGDRYRLGDPLTGPEVLSRQQLLARYTFTGFYMAIANGESGRPANGRLRFRPEATVE